MTSGEPPDVSQIYLHEIETDEAVEAELWDAITEKNLADWEAEWVPELFRLMQLLNKSGIKRNLWPQSRHWDWRGKTKAIESRLSGRSFSVVCNGVTQAMMILDLAKRARIEAQKNQHLVRVEYLEAAPWNRREMIGASSRFAGAGSILIRAAIELSKNEGFKGRIGLHSLPQANNFYANKCGMTDMGGDVAYQNLRYFEMTPEQAEAFIEKGRQK